MVCFEIADDENDRGVVRISASNVEKYRADLSWLLEPGVILTGITAAVTSDDAVVNGAGFTNDRKSAVWFIEATDVASTFDLALTLTTGDGQTLNFTWHYVVEVPDD